MQASFQSNVYLYNNNGGEVIDPPDEEVLAETDAVTQKGLYLACVTLTATNLDAASCQCEIRHRNDLNDDTIERIVVACPVDDSKQFELAFSLEIGERISVTPYVNGFLGTVWAAINLQKVA